MSNYAMYFDYDNKTYRLPTNSEQLEVNSVQAVEKYEVLKIGQIAIPTHMELKEYNFECEFPLLAQHYVETAGGFKSADFYIKLFEKWRNKLEPVRFTASNGVGEDISLLVLIEDLTITEKAGEEGDKYISFKLVEYKEFKKIPDKVETNKGIAKIVKVVATPKVSPKSNGSYVVKKGDTFWAIAKKFYGSGAQYPKIVTANKIKNANLIYSGDKLVIPS